MSILSPKFGCPRFMAGRRADIRFGHATQSVSWKILIIVATIPILQSRYSSYIFKIKITLKKTVYVGVGIGVFVSVSYNQVSLDTLSTFFFFLSLV